MKTMIALILDRSGSMGGRENDVVGGVNSFIAEQQKLPDPATIAMVRFDTGPAERFRPMATLAECKPLERNEYQPRGGTALLDAVGQTITALDEDWKREQPERCICVIVTDGEENSSSEYKKEQIKQMIQARQDSGKWAFIYLGANVDAFYEASSMGVSAANTAGYRSTSAGTASAYHTMSASVGHMRSTGSTFATNLGGDIDEDGTVTKTAQPAKAWSPQPMGTWVPPATAEATVTAWTPPG